MENLCNTCTKRCKDRTTGAMWTISCINNECSECTNESHFKSCDCIIGYYPQTFEFEGDWVVHQTDRHNNSDDYVAFNYCPICRRKL